MTRIAGSERIEEWLVQRVASLSGQSGDCVDVERAFADYQLDSSTAVTLTEELAALLGRRLPLTLFWEYPSIRALAAQLAREHDG